MRFHDCLSQAARLTLALTVAVSLSGCWASEGAGGASPVASTQTSELAREPDILVASTRKPIAGGGAPYFSSQRGQGLAFSTVRMTPPSSALLGRVAASIGTDWSVARLDPVQLGSSAAEDFAKAATGRDVLIYVHGYRESFETAAISAAQLSSGIGFQGATAMFAWPSGGATLDYAYDRESALWSRDSFEELLLALAESPSGGRIHIVAHSMGALMTLETLRTLRSSGGAAAMARIGAVVLAAPDIDIDLFTRSVERLGIDAKKLTVISATNDRALEISRRLAGGVVRAGAADREKLAQLGVRVADASDFGWGVFRHDLFISNDEVRAVVRRAIERQQ